MRTARNSASSLLLVPFFFLIISCASPADTPIDTYTIQSAGQALKVTIAEGTVNYLQCRQGDSLLSSWPLRYPVFRFLKGDVNNDGQEDLAVGVIKATRHDPVKRKRIFLFQVRNKAIIPLWLGSSLGQSLEDFTINRRDSVTVIRSIEQESSGRYLVAEYEWFGFGLTFREYLGRELSSEQARASLIK